jgi:hypothetical protein
MKTLFFGVITLFLIVGNDAQAACNAACRANCRATHQDAGLTYDQCVAKASKLNENPAEARRILNRHRCGSSEFVVGGHCYNWLGR